jgi:hypothetical protein
MNTHEDEIIMIPCKTYKFLRSGLHPKDGKSGESQLILEEMDLLLLKMCLLAIEHPS